jgi:hypothetical protein
MMEAFNSFEALTGRRQDIVNSFRKWGAPSGDILNPNTMISLHQASGAGRVPMVTWEPVLSNGTQGPYTLASIAAGEHDEYLRDWAYAVREHDGPIYLRLMHEMNGNWYPWAGDPVGFVKAWRHVVEVFAQVGAANAFWVWCVNTSDQPKGNALEKYWPGSDYVDVIGIDGYNCYGGWRPFGRIIGPAYARVAALDDKLPIWICETATDEARTWIAGAAGQTKAEWIRDLFATEGLDRVRALCWFDEERPASYDWRINTSYEATRELAAQLRKAVGWVPPPGPYVPPVPDRVRAVSDGPGSAFVSWRIVRSFTRGYRVYHLEPDGDWSVAAVVAKPALTVRINDLPAGEHTFAVRTYTLVRLSALSEPVTVQVAG